MKTLDQYHNTVTAIAEDCATNGYDVDESVGGSEWTFKPHLSRIAVYADPHSALALCDDEVCEKATRLMREDVGVALEEFTRAV